MPGYAKWILIILGIFFSLFILTRIGVFSGRRPTDLGVVSGKLTPCPGTPNCVSTQATDAEHTITPMPISGTVQQAQDHLIAVLDGLPLTNIVVNDPGYVYVEFQTGIMLYTDDVEFWFDETAGVIHFRSASRLGASDLGLNRRRMEDIRQKLAVTR